MTAKSLFKKQSRTYPTLSLGRSERRHPGIVKISSHLKVLILTFCVCHSTSYASSYRYGNINWSVDQGTSKGAVEFMAAQASRSSSSFRSIIGRTTMLLGVNTYFGYDTIKEGMLEIVPVSITDYRYFRDATITKEKLIILDESAPLQTDYVIDISHLNFEDEKSAVSFFDSYRDNLVQIKVDFNNKKITLHLFHENIMGTAWSVSHWNKYLATKHEKIITN